MYQHSNIRLPSWNNHVEHLMQYTLEWHWYWKRNGSLHHGDISERRKITRVRYHRAISHVEKNANAFKMQKMAVTLLDNRSRYIWAESCKR